MSDCLFCKIADGRIPAKVIYQDEDMVAFHDIHPIAPVHFLVIPRRHIASLADCQPEDAALLGTLVARIPALAKAQGLGQGFKTSINTGKLGGQEVFHLHLHVFGHLGK